jgi:pyrimidine-nucleoside phosphorylase
MTFRQAVERAAEAGASPAVFDSIIEQVCSATDEDLAALTRALAASGRQSPMRKLSADVASSGGPSSLTTLLCPLFLRLCGYDVPKVGVPGRPAGGVDVMATIPGFQIELTESQFEEVMQRDGFCHALAGGNLAPLDGALFAYRKRVGALAVPELAIASLLSKKLAVGVQNVILEVRVWSGGNFGTTMGDAQINALRFCKVASKLGISASCVLTDASLPFQPFIGRGESLLALYKVFEDAAEPWLQEHVDLCWNMVQSLTDIDRPTHFELRQEFMRHLVSQGTNWDTFEGRIEALNAQPVSLVHAPSDGYPQVNLEDLRAALVGAQDKIQEETFSDPAGVTLLVRGNAPVRAGTPVARVRHAGPDPTSGKPDMFRIVSQPTIPTSPSHVAVRDMIRS